MGAELIKTRCEIWRKEDVREVVCAASVHGLGLLLCKQPEFLVWSVEEEG